jgi:hypothetical protein
MVLKNRQEVKVFVIAIIIFTFLPAKIWLGIAAALAYMWRKASEGAKA